VFCRGGGGGREVLGLTQRDVVLREEVLFPCKERDTSGL